MNKFSKGLTISLMCIFVLAGCGKDKEKEKGFRKMACSQQEEIDGLTNNVSLVFEMEDGKITKFSEDVTVDYSQTDPESKAAYDESAELMTEEAICEGRENCTATVIREPGVSIKYSVSVPFDPASYGITQKLDDKTADEIYDILKKSVEPHGYTCK